MNIPPCVTNSITKDVMDNNYFYGADEMWGRLKLVRDGIIPYLNIDMSMLANCIECSYKGLLEASKANVPEHIMKESHNLLRLVEEIETKICPLQYNMSKNDERDRRTFLLDFGSKYIDCRYNNGQVDFADFCKCYDWVKGQRTKIEEILKYPVKGTPSGVNGPERPEEPDGR